MKTILLSMFLGAVTIAEAQPEKPEKPAPKPAVFPREPFEIKGHAAFVILPPAAAVPAPQNPAVGRAAGGGGIPWVLYAPTFDKPLPSDRDEGWMMRHFLNTGIAIADVDVGESYGSPAGIKPGPRVVATRRRSLQM